MLGRMSSDNESTISGTRCQTDKILEIVQVFPHGACRVREIFFDLIKTLNTSNGKLRSYRSLISIGNWGEASYPELLNTNIWSLRYQTIPMPSGYYEEALGQTFVWVDYWTWHPTSFWTSWLESSDEPIKENRQPFLEVSCLTWFYKEMGDYETSLVIELHKPMGQWIPELGRYVDPPFLEQLREAATQLAEQIRQFLKDIPPSETSIRHRQARLDSLLKIQEQEKLRIASEKQADWEKAQERIQQKQVKQRELRRSALKVAILYTILRI